MAYSSNRDWNISELEYTKTPWPLPPLNLFLTSGYTPGVFDLRWDDPTTLPLNSTYQLLGINVYRSFDSEFGPFNRISELLVCSNFWRDQTDNELIIEEEITPDKFVLDGECSGSSESGPRWVFKTLHSPIIKEGSQAVTTDSPDDVRVQIDGVTVRPLAVHGFSGEVEINPYIYADVTRQKFDPSLVPGPNSRVTCTYRRNRSLLKTDLGQRVFYRVTSVGVRVGCDLSKVQCQDLIETPLENATATSSMEIEKIDYIWREGVRRNRFILEQGGERVKVFIRKLVGVPCSCFPDDTHKQPINDCHKCFPPGTKVRTENGYRSIEEISVGEKVLTEDGTFRPVSSVLVNDYQGELVSIRSSVSASPVTATPSHPFKMLVGNHGRVRCQPKYCQKIVDRGNGISGNGGGVRRLPSGRWWARVGAGKRGQRLSLGAYSTESEALEVVNTYRSTHNRSHTLEWVDADSVEPGSWLVAQYDRRVEDLEYVDVPCLKTSKYGPPRQGATRFVVNEEFLWVIGLYLAEGSAADRHISFALHEDEIDFQSRVAEFFERHGYSTSISRISSSRGVVVNVFGTHLSEWLPSWVGDGCQNKHIPESLMQLPPKKQEALIRGVYDGDGWKNGTEITQTSEILALQLSELLHRVGKSPLIRHQRSKKLTPIGNERRLAFCVSWESEAFTNRSRKGRWVFEGHDLAVVHSSEKIPYCGKVYNLTVEGNHTYVVQGVVVHNCYGTGILGGFEGPYDALIAPDDAERRIAQKDVGRTLEHAYEVWTGPSPILSQRDFLVKINGERYSVGPVRFPSNRGMVLQQHFNIGHLDEKDIRYKVPVGNPVKYSAVQFSPRGPESEADASITDKPNIPEERQLKGRTKVWENSEY